MYVPILKSKQGEMKALETLDSTPGNADVQPLIEVLGDAQDDVEALVSRAARKLAIAWPARRDRPAMIDVSYVEVEEGQEAGDILVSLIKQLSHQGSQAMPVVHISDSEATLRSVAELCAEQGRGACLRIVNEDLDDSVVPLHTLAVEVAHALHLPERQIDVILDFGALADDGAQSMASRLGRFILPALQPRSWRSVTVAGGAFPVNLSDVPPRQTGRFARHDWGLWRSLSRADFGRALQFGDYAVTHPQLQVGIAFAAPPQLRYTVGEEWLVLKGRRNDRRGHQQFFDLCHQLLQDHGDVALPAGSSWGDDVIHEAARSSVEPPTRGPGNASTWRAIGTSHHISWVLADLSRLGAR